MIQVHFILCYLIHALLLFSFFFYIFLYILYYTSLPDFVVPNSVSQCVVCDASQCSDFSCPQQALVVSTFISMAKIIKGPVYLDLAVKYYIFLHIRTQKNMAALVACSSTSTLNFLLFLICALRYLNDMTCQCFGCELIAYILLVFY